MNQKCPAENKKKLSKGRPCYCEASKPRTSARPSPIRCTSPGYSSPGYSSSSTPPPSSSPISCYRPIRECHCPTNNNDISTGTNNCFCQTQTPTSTTQQSQTLCYPRDYPREKSPSQRCIDLMEKKASLKRLSNSRPGSTSSKGSKRRCCSPRKRGKSNTRKNECKPCCCSQNNSGHCCCSKEQDQGPSARCSEIELHKAGECRCYQSSDLKS